MSWVKTDIEQGIGLTDEELVELVEMVESGNYYQCEIEEWFGISRAKLKTYMKIAEERGIKPHAKVDRSWKNRRRANQSSVW